MGVLSHDPPQIRGKCLIWLPREGKWPVLETSTNQHTWSGEVGVNLTVSEGIWGMPSLFWLDLA